MTLWPDPPPPDSQPPRNFSKRPLRKKNFEARSFSKPLRKKIWKKNTKMNIKSPYFFPFASILSEQITF